MRFPSFEKDYFRLDSAVERNRQFPETFDIPDEAARTSIRPGELARLRFEVEFEDPEEGVVREAERMWVCVREVCEWGYIGVLVSKPAYPDEADDVYLAWGAEIPFTADHVMDINRAVAPAEALEKEVMKKPTRRWPG